MTSPNRASAHLPTGVRPRPFHIISAHLRVYVLLNIAAYGLTVAGFAAGIIFPQLVSDRSAALHDDGTAELVEELVSVPPLFALTILAVNVGRLSLLTILLPSMLVPFAGLGLFGYWAVETGITLAPTTTDGWVALIPHSLTVVIELQAYILLLLGAFLLGRYWLSPASAGLRRHRDGYRAGLRRIGVLALPAFALLVVGAAWEAYSLRYLVHPLRMWLL